MIITIHQPDFMPWLGFFDRWEKSDLYIILDNVQYIKRGWHNRDKIKTPHGVKWLTVPVKTKGRYHQLIKDVELDNESNWQRKHLAAILEANGQAPNCDAIYPELERIYYAGQQKLIDLNIEFLQLFARLLKIQTPTAFASDIAAEGSKTERLVNLVLACKGTAYLTGEGSRGYLEEDLFRQHGIKVQWQGFEHPCYPQLHGEFEPGLSALDFLMNRKQT